MTNKNRKKGSMEIEYGFGRARAIRDKKGRLRFSFVYDNNPNLHSNDYRAMAESFFQKFFEEKKNYQGKNE